MSFSLVPLTAILLLLSGMGTPMHAEGYVQTIAALKNQWLREGLPASSRAETGLRAQGYRTLVGAFGSGGPDRHVYATSIAASIASMIPREAERKRYRTRFGSGGGAYLAAGPPAMDFCAHVG